MRHEMKLAPEPFRKVYDGQKTIELRLYDEKRSQISVGDEIIFSHSEKPQFRVRAEVITLHRFPTFEELYAALPLTECGYTKETAADASADDMLEYYTAEQQAQYGVVGIEIKVTVKPYRDVYRFESFLAELSELWQRVPDWRFGQLMLNFQRWLEYNKHGDGFYLEDDKYIELFREFMNSLRR